MQLKPIGGLPAKSWARRAGRTSYTITACGGDIFDLIDTGHRADYRRELRGIADASGRHWVFKP
jgi:hypothetical protein